MIPYIAALAGALLMWLAFPPFDIGILAFVAPAPFLWGLRRVETGAGALAVGFVYGSLLAVDGKRKIGGILRWFFLNR